METMDMFSTNLEDPPAVAGSRVKACDNPAPPTCSTSIKPSQALLLEVDRLYRDRAAKDQLPKIAPSFLNRSGIAWLPLMQLRRGNWRFSVKFSNSLRANQMGKTNDWVIIKFRSSHPQAKAEFGQVTVVSEPISGDKAARTLRGYD